MSVDDDIKISGVTLGRVEAIDHEPGGLVGVNFSLDDDVALPEDCTIAIRSAVELGHRARRLRPRWAAT